MATVECVDGKLLGIETVALPSGETRRNCAQRNDEVERDPPKRVVHHSMIGVATYESRTDSE